MTKPVKILITGVGGQGIVYLTDILVKAAALANIRVSTSEVHGLAQRGGCVKAGITIGDNTYGFIEEGGVDILLGLEALEAQRCVSYLNHDSVVIIDGQRILPSSVNTGISAYPDIRKFIAFLKGNVKTVRYLDEETRNINPLLRNLYVLGTACGLDMFPIQPEYVKKSIQLLSKKDMKEESVDVFESALLNNVQAI